MLQFWGAYKPGLPKFFWGAHRGYRLGQRDMFKHLPTEIVFEAPQYPYAPCMVYLSTSLADFQGVYVGINIPAPWLAKLGYATVAQRVSLGI